MKLKTSITIERDGVEREVEVTGHYSPPEHGYEAQWSDVDSEAVTLTPEEREYATEELAEEMIRREDRDDPADAYLEKWKARREDP